MKSLQLHKLVDEKAEISFLKGLAKVKDIFYYDGPLLSLFGSDKNENYIYYWVDTDQQFINRWLIFKVNSSDIELCYKKEKDLKNIILNPIDFIYCVDVDYHLDYHNVGIVYPNQLPEDYLPGDGCFFED